MYKSPELALTSKPKLHSCLYLNYLHEVCADQDKLLPTCPHHSPMSFPHSHAQLPLLAEVMLSCSKLFLKQVKTFKSEN